MNTKRLNLALAAIFLLVGILATANTIRLNNYIKATVPQDVAQTQCNTETIKVLQSWIEARIERDAAMDARDDAAVAVLEPKIFGQEPTPEQIRVWRDAVAHDRQVRDRAGEERIPLPKC
jgi:hypothetical protein